MQFCEVYHQLQYGHKVRREAWPADTYIRLYVLPVNGFTPKRALYLCNSTHKEYYKPEQEDMLATDWEYGNIL